jgi:fibronectin type 3 domain-containing protein
MIFSDNTTDYTLELPKMYKAAVSDTMSLRGKIKNAERNILKLNSEINEYKSQKWEYIVQRKNIKEDKDSWVTISSGADVSRFVDKDVKEGDSYMYRVKAKNSKGVSKWSSEVNNRIPTTSLRSPSYLIAKTNLNFEVEMHWTDNSYNEDGFIVERKLLGSAKWAMLANVDSDVRQYTDNTIITGKTYEYRVHAVGIGEKSNPTNIVSRKITLPSPYNVTDQSNINCIG